MIFKKVRTVKIIISKVIFGKRRKTNKFAQEQLLRLGHFYLRRNFVCFVRLPSILSKFFNLVIATLFFVYIINNT
jgi:hypothetical protein